MALTQSLDAIEEAIERHIASDGELDRLAKALRGVRGVGPNTPEALAAWIARARPALVGIEPTGGYERALCSALAEAGVRHVKLHPNTILAFRKARGLRAKTDPSDHSGAIRASCFSSRRRRWRKSSVASMAS